MIADGTRQLRADTCGDWVCLVYRAALYTLAATPIWGAGVMVVVVWRHAQL